MKLESSWSMPWPSFRLVLLLGFFGSAGLIPVIDSKAFAEDSKAQAAWQKAFEQDVLPIVQAKCVSCHDADDPEGGVDLQRYQSGAEVAAHFDVWEAVGKRVRLREMPPEGSPQLTDPEKARFHRWLDSRPPSDDCASIATEETQAWYRGYVMSRRLTRTEVCNAIEDLVGVPVDGESELPSDGSGGEGFDTAGDALFTSPIHVEKYLAIANRVIESATPDSLDGQTESIAAARFALLKPLLPDDGSNESNNGSAALIDDPAKVALTLRRFARRAWRRPVTDDEVGRLMTLYDVTRDRGVDVLTAIREPLKAVLISPNFLFVVETEDPDGGIQRLTSHQLATRLALFLWSSIPDEELLTAADDGALQTKEQVLAQTRRMLVDPKARALGENFGLQWLGLTQFLNTVRPDQEVFPDFNDALAKDLREEAVRTIASVFQQDRSVLEWLDADHVHVNGRLAAHYGLDLPTDAPWQRYPVEDRSRGGVITTGAVLASTSYPRRTSPVLRGRWILEEVLGSRVPPPPPGVPPLDEHEVSETATLRERLEAHRRDPGCASCHNRMDPLGFGLENFDALGRWRDVDNGQPIDSSGKLPSGEPFAGPAELKQILLKRSGELEKHLVRKLLGFALGRELNKFDQCVVEDAIEALRQNQHRASAVVETIVLSYPFQHRYFKAAR